jgi:hypothetical protein
MELTHAGPKTASREAELRRPSGVVCSDLVRQSHFDALRFVPGSFPKMPNNTNTIATTTGT